MLDNVYEIYEQHEKVTIFWTIGKSWTAITEHSICFSYLMIQLFFESFLSLAMPTMAKLINSLGFSPS